MGWLTAILASGSARKALGFILAAITIALVPLNFGAPVNGLGGWPIGFQHRKKHMKSHGRCWTPPAAAPLIAILWLTACKMADSDDRPWTPVVQYSATKKAKSAADLVSLPVGTVVIKMLWDYIVLRDQAPACR